MTIPPFSPTGPTAYGIGGYPPGAGPPASVESTADPRDPDETPVIATGPNLPAAPALGTPSQPPPVAPPLGAPSQPPPAASPTSGASSPAAATGTDDAAADDGEQCSDCGAVNRGTSTFCRSCGEPLGPDPLVGRTIEDRYEVVRRLGAGAMGAVYEVKHTRLAGKRFAMKMVRQVLGDEPEFAARFEQEALSSSRLSHPNCIAVTDFGKTRDGQLFLVMEFLEGRELSKVMEERWPVTRALAAVRQILLGLEHAHEAGVIHRDVKPENVMLLSNKAGEDRMKVVDFGIARLPAAGSRAGQGERLTRAGLVIGTPEYMSPEQSLGSANVDERADVYAVGVILWELLVGRPPLTANNPIELLERKLAQDAPRLGDACPGVFSAETEQLLARALERNPSRRFASAREMIDFIEAIQRQPGGGMRIAEQRGALSRFFGLYRDWWDAAPTLGGRLGALVKGAPGFTVLGTALLVLILPIVLAVSLGGKASDAAARDRVLRGGGGGGGDPGSAAGGTAKVALRRGSGGKAQRRSHAKALQASRSAKLDRATERALVGARKLLERYACKAARGELSRIVAKRPKVALAHYLQGSALVCTRDVKAGLAAYGRAIALDRELKRDARLLGDLGGLLKARRRSHRSAAMSFIETTLGKAGASLMVKAATSKHRRLREAAVAATIRFGVDKRVDWVRSLELDLRQLSCRKVKRLRIVERLAKYRDDPRVYKILKRARYRRAGFFRHRYRYGCVLGALKDALRDLKPR